MLVLYKVFVLGRLTYIMDLNVLIDVEQNILRSNLISLFAQEVVEKKSFGNLN